MRLFHERTGINEEVIYELKRRIRRKIPDFKFLFEKYVLRQHRRSWQSLEPKVIKQMRKFHGDLFVDVGCNCKFYPNLLKNNFSRIVTVDPNPKWHADMEVALSNFNGRATFYIGDNEGSADSLLYLPHIIGKSWEQKTSIKVNVTTFDDLELDPDLVKIDVEGAEFEVLEGMQKYVPKNLVIELHDERREHELIEKVVQKGYRTARKIDDTHWWFTVSN